MSGVRKQKLGHHHSVPPKAWVQCSWGRLRGKRDYTARDSRSFDLHSQFLRSPEDAGQTAVVSLGARHIRSYQLPVAPGKVEREGHGSTDGGCLFGTFGTDSVPSVVNSRCGQKHSLNPCLNAAFNTQSHLQKIAKAFWAQFPMHTRRGIDLRDREWMAYHLCPR